MLAALDVPAPPINVLIISESSRIGRASARTLYAITQIEEAGVQIYSYLKGRRVTMEDEAGEVETMVDALVSSLERRRVSSRVSDALRLRAERGQVAGGKAPFGYEQYRDGDVSRRGIREDQAVIVKRIFTDTANGIGL